MLEREEGNTETEQPSRYNAIVLPSYGMSRWRLEEAPVALQQQVMNGERAFNEYRLSAFGGWECRAGFEIAVEIWKAHGYWPHLVIGGAKIFKGDPKNDGDSMKTLLLQLRDGETGIGIPEERIIQTRDATNTYNQLLHARDAIRQLGIKGRVLTIHADLHEYRVPALVDIYGMNSDTAIAEDILSDRYPAFRSVWDEGYVDRQGVFQLGMKHEPSYKKTKELEANLARLNRLSHVARGLSWIAFNWKGGADVPDIRKRATVRSY
ncbi:MAG: hypothetical protein US51_C0020G0002 [Microgenomates group bacterium GW2011_GWA2_37_6]|nr:MAG: hypothetical protein US51_C0020G0002 [Microgenomates group bacterium GW2011_GWA2_37_6]